MTTMNLSCVWQAVSSCNPNHTGYVTKSALRTVTGHFAHLRRIKADPDHAFMSTFADKGDNVDYGITLKEYSSFVSNTLCKQSYAMCLLEDDIQHICWDLCARNLEDSGYDICDRLKHLWQIFGRLCEQGSIPPILPAVEVNWLAKKLCGDSDSSKGCRTSNKDAQTFEGLLDLIDFKTVGSKDRVQRVIDQVHTLLVKEVLKSGYMWKRTRKDKSKKWTEWRKRWFVLSLGQLKYYDNQNLTTCKGTLQIKTSVTLSDLPDTRRLAFKLTGCFSLIWTDPLLKLEMSTMDTNQKAAWIAALKEVQDAHSVGSTPVRRALSKRSPLGNVNNFFADFASALPFVENVTEPQSDVTVSPNMHMLNDSGIHDTTSPSLCQAKRLVMKRTKLSMKEPNRRGHRLQSIPDDQREKIRGIFYSIDEDRNGFIDSDEFFQFLIKLGLKMSKDEVNVIFEHIQGKKNGKITMDGFYAYFVRTILHETSSTTEEGRLRNAFLNADRDQSGSINFREFVEYVWEKRRSIRISRVLSTFKKMDKTASGEVKYMDFAEVMQNDLSPRIDLHPFQRLSKSALYPETLKDENYNSDNTANMDSPDYCNNNLQSNKIASPMQRHVISNTTNNFSTVVDSEDTDDNNMNSDSTDSDKDLQAPEDLLRVLYDDAAGDDTAGLIGYLHKRWIKLISFKRPGASGEIVLKGQGNIISDVLPGDYTLLDLAAFSDLPALIPRHTHLTGVQWNTALPGMDHGTVIFPSDFDGVLPVEVATSELLRFYGCSLANSAAVKVSLLYRHAIQDFTYENQYLEDFVTNPKMQGGSGLERHDFSHLDMPLEGGGGYLVLAKLDDGDMKLTAFAVPIHHCVYIPGGTIHTNDYLCGTWRTMLSDQAPVDHCHITRSTSLEEQNEKLFFQFD